MLRYGQMKPRRKKLINPDTLVLLKQIGIGVLVLSFTSLIVAGIWYGSRLETFTIANVTVEGGETISHDLIKNIAEEEMKGEYLGIVPKQFAWFYPQSEIETALSKIERITNVSLSVIDDKELRITFDEYVPYVLWCNSVDSKDCLFVDDKGYAFAKAPNLSGGSFLRFSKLGEETKLQTEMVGKEQFSKLIEIKNLLEARDWFVSQIEIDKEEDAYLKLSPSSDLKITLRQSPTETVDNLFAVLSSEEFATLKPGNFNYIDLRYGNKVFVKVADNVAEEDSSLVATSTDSQ